MEAQRPKRCEEDVFGWINGMDSEKAVGAVMLSPLSRAPGALTGYRLDICGVRPHFADKDRPFFGDWVALPVRHDGNVEEALARIDALKSVLDDVANHLIHEYGPAATLAAKQAAASARFEAMESAWKARLHATVGEVAEDAARQKGGRRPPRRRGEAPAKEPEGVAEEAEAPFEPPRILSTPPTSTPDDAGK